MFDKISLAISISRAIIANEASISDDNVNLSAIFTA
jgi:hypothetical protein